MGSQAAVTAETDQRFLTKNSTDLPDWNCGVNDQESYGNFRIQAAVRESNGPAAYNNWSQSG